MCSFFDHRKIGLGLILIALFSKSAFSNIDLIKYLEQESEDTEVVEELDELARAHETLPTNVEMSGEEFNNLFEGKLFIKFIKNNRRHYDYTFHQGINKLSDNLIRKYEYEMTDEVFYRCFFRRTRKVNKRVQKQVPEEFKPGGSCNEGGLYFTDLARANDWSSHGNPTIIKIPDNARVWLEHNKFKADMIDIDFNHGLDSKKLNAVINQKPPVKLKSAEIWPLEEALESGDDSESAFNFADEIAKNINIWLISNDKNDQSETTDILLKVGYIYGEILRTMEVLNFNYKNTKLYDAYLKIYSLTNLPFFKIPPVAPSRYYNQLQQAIEKYATRHKYSHGTETYNKFVQWVLFQFLYNHLTETLYSIDSNYRLKFETKITIGDEDNSAESPGTILFSKTTKKETREDIETSEANIEETNDEVLSMQLMANNPDILKFDPVSLLSPETKCLHSIFSFLEEYASDNPYLYLIVTPLKKRLSSIPGVR